MPGMPEKPRVSWLELTEAATDSVADASVWMTLFANLPGLDEGDDRMFAPIPEKIARYVREQIGERAWREAYNRAVDRFNALMDAVRDRSLP